MRLCVLPLIAVSTNCIATQDTWVNVHTVSYHAVDTIDVEEDGESTTYDINGINPGLGWEAPLNSGGRTRTYTSYRAGFFKNSYKNTSLYLVLDAHTKNTNGPGAGLLMGVVSGYDLKESDRPYVPAVVPYVKYIYNGYKAEVSFNYGLYASAIGLTLGVAL